MTSSTWLRLSRCVASAMGVLPVCRLYKRREAIGTGERGSPAGGWLLISQFRSEGDTGFLHGRHLQFPGFFLTLLVAALGDLVPFLDRLVQGFLRRQALLQRLGDLLGEFATILIAPRDLRI